MLLNFNIYFLLSNNNFTLAFWNYTELQNLYYYDYNIDYMYDNLLYNLSNKNKRKQISPYIIFISYYCFRNYDYC